MWGLLPKLNLMIWVNVVNASLRKANGKIIRIHATDLIPFYEK